MKFIRDRSNEIIAINEATDKHTIIKKPEPGRSLGEARHDIAAEWNPEKNGELTPLDIAVSSNLKVWWKCSKGHEWQAKLFSRSRDGSACPYCEAYGTSYGEQFIYWSFKQLFPDIDGFKQISNREKLNGYEYDIVVTSLNLCIEYSGVHWHKGKAERDKKKKENCEKLNIDYIEVVENHKPVELYLSKNYIEYYRDNNQNQNLQLIVNYIINHYGITQEIDFDLVEQKAKRYSHGEIEYEKSLAGVYPEIAKYWDIEANGGLTAGDITPRNSFIAGWICDKGHKYTMQIRERTRRNTGCPYCSGHRVLVGFNDLATKRPDIAAMWHPTLNGDLTPKDVTWLSNKEVAWLLNDGSIKYSRISSMTDKRTKVKRYTEVEFW